jgi:hypothetical protein
MSPVAPTISPLTSIAPVVYQRVRLTPDFGRD